MSLPLQQGLSQASVELIHIEARRADVMFRIDWPVSSAAQCG